jgi:hypothetical protein
VLGTSALINETFTRMTFLKRAIDETPSADTSLARRVRVLESRLRDAQEALTGDPTRAIRQEPAPQSLQARLQGAVSSAWSNSLSALNPSQQAQIDVVRREFGTVYSRVQQIVEVDLKALERDADAAGVPWTPGRIPKPPL